MVLTSSCCHAGSQLLKHCERLIAIPYSRGRIEERPAVVIGKQHHLQQRQGVGVHARPRLARGERRGLRPFRDDVDRLMQKLGLDDQRGGRVVADEPGDAVDNHGQLAVVLDAVLPSPRLIEAPVTCSNHSSKWLWYPAVTGEPAKERIDPAAAPDRTRCV